MCRVLAYLGEPIAVEDLLYKPDVSFVNQTHQAALLHRLNLAGSGILAWDSHSVNPDDPYIYRSIQPAIYDRNLRALARKVQATCILAHLRGVAYDSKAIIGEQNLHPFLFERAQLALAHNGQLAQFEEMKYDLLPYMRPELVAQVRGSTDSEWIYALLLSQFSNPYANLTATEIAKGVEQSLQIIAKVRKQRQITTFSPLNLFLSDGNDLVAACFTFGRDHYEGLPNDFHPPDEKALRIWYTKGKSYGYHNGEWSMREFNGTDASSCIIASEPLTKDRSTWSMVPAQHLIYLRRQDGISQVALTALHIED